MDLLVQAFGYFNTGKSLLFASDNEIRTKEQVLNKRKDCIGLVLIYSLVCCEVKRVNM